ncbi:MULTISPECIES: hypothetical protein [unclassified Streptomyces]|uniref:hypothetical protein n=1 Tax=unclassified Streptomyces TaxID=2593676 RepID=UPI00278C487E|nr:MULTISPECIES: hypothetical protein [unclassified Streptomyces]
MKVALDLISIHAEREVRGRVPRASLNPFIAIAAVAAWERFLADLVGAATFTDAEWHDKGYPDGDDAGQDDEPAETKRGPGHFSLPRGAAYEPEQLNGYLRNQGILKGNLTDGWAAQLAGSWTGATPKAWRFAEYVQDPDAFRAALKSAQNVRNGAAHMALPATVVVPEAHRPAGVPDGSATAVETAQAQYYWTNDAIAPTIQNGHARGVTALCVQLIDSSIVRVAKEVDCDPTGIRLPAGWLDSTVSGPRRDRYFGLTFWGGKALHRVE